jgi:hypothetical protein
MNIANLLLKGIEPTMKMNFASQHDASELAKPVSKVHRPYKRGFAVIALFVFGLLGAGYAQAATAVATTTTLAISPTSASADTVVTLTATVTNPAAVKVGLVKFCDASASYCTDAALIGTAQLTSAGTAVLKTVPGLVPAGRTYKAIFVGTTANASSTSSTVTLTMTGTYATTTTLATSGTAGNYTLTGTVVGTGFGHLAPTGSVSFLDTTNGSLVVASGALGSGTLAQSFGAQVPYTVGTGPQSLVVGDFNGDGKPDMVVVNSGSGTMSSLTGSGTGTFVAKAGVSVGSNPYAVAVGDFNGDGKLDVVITDNSKSGKVDYLQGNGDGTFKAAATTSTGRYPVAVAVGDFNGDGIPDLVTANSTDNTVSVLLNSSSSPGTFSVAATPAVLSSPSSLALADFNGDGFSDLVVGYSAGTQISILSGTSTSSYTTRTDITVGSTPISVAAGDFNGDGKPDIAVVNNNSGGSGTVGILVNTGSGFETQVTYPVGANPITVATGDFNQDGKTDLVVTNEGTSGAGNTVSVLFGNGDGTFKAAVPATTGAGPFSVAVGDFNGDGLPDLAVTNYGSLGDCAGNGTTVSVLLGSVTQTATATQSAVSIPGTGSHAIDASYPTDGNFTASISATTSLTASVETTTLSLSVLPTSSTYGIVVMLTTTLNPSTLGNQVASGTVTFKNGATVLGTATPNSSGVAAFPIGTLPVGTDSLTAVYSGDTKFAGSTSNTVSFVVTKATPVLTWATPTAIAYPTALSATQLNATSGTVAGTFVYSPILGTILAPGSQTLSVTFTPTDTTDYNSATASVTLTVTKGTPIITWPTPAAITYPTALSATQLNATAGGLAGNFIYLPAAGAVLSAGSQALSVTFIPTDTTHYNSIVSGVTLTVNKAVLTVTPFNSWKLLNAANPTFTSAMTGFVNGDTQALAVTGAPVLTTTALTTSPVGRYPITPTAGTLAATNYSFAFVNAVLTITATGAQPNIQGRWEFAITSGDTPAQTSLMGQSTVSSYVMQSGATLSIISAFNANTIACDTDAGSNASLSGSSINTSGDATFNFTFVEPGSATFNVVFTGALYSGTPMVITGTYQRTAGGCTMGSLGNGSTPDGNFTATYFPDISGTLNGSFDSPDIGQGTGSAATFVLTTNADKSLSGTVTAAGLKNSSAVACFVGTVTLKAGMIQGTSQSSGIGIELFGTDANGTSLWVNAYSTNADGSVAAVGEDNPADGTNGTGNDGTNGAYTAYYGITGGPCDGEGGGDAPFILATKLAQVPRHHRAPTKGHHAVINHRFHPLELRLQSEANPRHAVEAVDPRNN